MKLVLTMIMLITLTGCATSFSASQALKGTTLVPINHTPSHP